MMVGIYAPFSIKHLYKPDERRRFFYARLFGKRIVAIDKGIETVGYHWRGGIYITQVRILKEQPHE